MPFLSPFELLEPQERNLGGELLRQAVRRARRRWLSEFQLSGELQFGAEKVRLDKDAMLKLLDELDDPQRAHLHRELFHHPLHDFISGKGDGMAGWPVSDPELQEFCEPFFAEAYLARYKACFLAGDYAKLLKLADVFAPGEEHREEPLLEELRSFFQTRLLRASALVEELKKSKLLAPELEQLLSVQTVSFWNRLPPGFSGMRTQLMQIYFDFYNETIHLPNLLSLRQKIMRCAELLQLELEGLRLRQQLLLKHAGTLNAGSRIGQEKDNSSPDTDWAGCLGYLVAFVILIAIAAGVRSCGGSSSRRTDPMIEQIEGTRRVLENYKPVQIPDFKDRKLSAELFFREAAEGLDALSENDPTGAGSALSDSISLSTGVDPYMGQYEQKGRMEEGEGLLFVNRSKDDAVVYAEQNSRAGFHYLRRGESLSLQLDSTGMLRVGVFKGKYWSPSLALKGRSDMLFMYSKPRGGFAKRPKNDKVSGRMRIISMSSIAKGKHNFVFTITSNELRSKPQTYEYWHPGRY